MGTLILKTNPKFTEKFAEYPDRVREKMQFLRDLVIETAAETAGVTELGETLKWGEPAFVTKRGSTLRMDWKEKNPEHYAVYFQCSTRLVDTFRMVFDGKFKFEGNRAIVFGINQNLPSPELRECIKTALTCHGVKHLEALGI